MGIPKQILTTPDRMSGPPTLFLESNTRLLERADETQIGETTVRFGLGIVTPSFSSGCAVYLLLTMQISTDALVLD